VDADERASAPDGVGGGEQGADAKPKKTAAQRLGGCFRGLLWLGVIFLLLVYNPTCYHDALPVPGIAEMARNVDYEMSGGRRLADAKGGGAFYVWSITNKNDFDWPQAAVLWGDEHWAPLGRVRAGQDSSFTNLIMYRVQKSGNVTDAAAFIKGRPVKLELMIDFKGERTIRGRLKEALGLSRERYSIGTID
jgi:hypothetical protein